MIINVKEENDLINLLIDGRIDTQTAPNLQKKVDEFFSLNKKKIIMDFDKVQYISSAGLRVMLYIQKKINSFGVGATFEIINVCPSVKEVFEMTGFSDFLTITNKNG